VYARTDLRRTAPWLLCAVSIVLLALAAVLPWFVVDPASPTRPPQATVEALGFVGIPVVGALIASRLPTNPYGWVWCAAGLAAALSEAGGPVLAVVHGPAWVGWLLDGWGFVVLIGLLVFVFLLFPTGRLPTARWRWLARAAVAVTVLLVPLASFVYDEGNPVAASPWALHGEGGRHLRVAVAVGVYAVIGAVLLAMFSLLLRFRRADAVQRRQLTWFVYATAVNALVIVFAAVLSLLPTLFDAVVNAVGFLLLPAAVAVAMLRYRLFEIDRIVSRTVSYGLLTAVLVGVYLLVVAVLRALLEPLTGSSTLAVAGSTLAAAAVFNPARRRLQAAVDRRFDRARYDAARAVDAFTARLREQVDLDEITTGLCDTVTATVAPGRVNVWLRPSTGARGGER
jgi:MFS family permease